MNNTPLYQLADITPEKIVISEHKMHEKIVENSQNFHQNLAKAGAKPGEKDAFEVELKPRPTSAINCTVSQAGKMTHHTYVDIFPNHAVAIGKVNFDIDKMLQKVKGEFSPEQYKDLLVIELVKLGHPEDKIEEKYRELLDAIEVPFNDEWFRYVATSFLIHTEHAKDVKGVELDEAMTRLREIYANALDANLTIKKKIYAGIGLPAKLVKESCLSLIDPIQKWQEHREVKGLLDYSKSPQMHVKLMEGIPRADAKPQKDKIVADPYSGHLIYTTVIDYVANPNSNSAITTYDALQSSIYRKGDSANGKPLFRLMQNLTVTAPSAYWGQKTKRCEIQWKAVKTKITKKEILSSGSRNIRDDERERDLAEAREMAEYCNFPDQPTQTEAPSLKRSGQSSPDAQDYNDYDNADMDNLIEAQDGYYQEQPQTKKSKYH